jgi:hypothetical protein
MTRFSSRLALLLTLLCGGTPVAVAVDTYLAPQLDYYYTHNKVLRSHGVLSVNYLANESEVTTGWFQYDMDFGLVSFFRRYLFKDPNAEKSKRVTFRVGYLQVTDFKTDPAGYDEKRVLAEIVLRQPIGRAWLLEDRNRKEFRRVNGAYSERWRFRIRLERNTRLSRFRFTPYTTGEFFYSEAEDRWNESQYAFGTDFPMKKQMIFNVEGMGQFVDGDYSTFSIGIGLQKYM